MCWLFGFRDETWKPLRAQLAESSVLGVLSGCQGSWKVVVICCANNKLVLMFGKSNPTTAKGADSRQMLQAGEGSAFHCDGVGSPTAPRAGPKPSPAALGTAVLTFPRRR